MLAWVFWQTRRRQWLWLSGQMGRFKYQRSADRKSSHGQYFIKNIFTANYLKYENKEKGGREWLFICSYLFTLKNCSLSLFKHLQFWKRSSKFIETCPLALDLLLSKPYFVILNWMPLNATRNKFYRIEFVNSAEMCSIV